MKNFDRIKIIRNVTNVIFGKKSKKQFPFRHCFITNIEKIKYLKSMNRANWVKI